MVFCQEAGAVFRSLRQALSLPNEQLRKIQERKTNQEQQLQQLQEQNVEDASIKETELVAIADLGEPSPTSRALANSNDSI